MITPPYHSKGEMENGVKDFLAETSLIFVKFAWTKRKVGQDWLALFNTVYV